MTDSSTTNRSKLLDRLREEREGWDTLLAQLSEEQQTLPRTLDLWSVKDLIAHVAYYEGRAARRIMNTRAGQPESPMDATFDALSDDERNRCIFQQTHAESLVVVRQRAQAEFERLLEATALMDDADLAGTSALGNALRRSWGLDETPSASIESEAWGHYADHRPALDALVERLRAQATRA
jgi:uncharacterized damage-inducible protein DinB